MLFVDERKGVLKYWDCDYEEDVTDMSVEMLSEMFLKSDYLQTKAKYEAAILSSKYHLAGHLPPPTLTAQTQA